MANALAYLNVACMFFSGLAVAAGWIAIRRGKRTTHRWLMITAAYVAAGFFLSYILKSLWIGDTTFGGPARWRPWYQGFLQVHSALATVGAILGIIALYYGLKGRFARHRKVGPWTAGVWLVTAATGITVFLLLYVVFPPGPTTNMFRAWTGH
ncbi:MAG: DUF420 domain-containing protein [Alicyclobacillaceae bacterium]|nr:DUF420 domain-containing protein [Alicyclobacillaceae bacterium]